MKGWVIKDGATGEIVFRTKSKPTVLRELAKLNEQHGTKVDNQRVSATPVRRHLAQLRLDGVGLKRVAVLAKVTYGVLCRIVNGEIKKTSHGLAQRVLAVSLQTGAAAGARMRGDGTLVLIDRLLKAGYTRGFIAREIGRSIPHLQLLKASRWIKVRSARAVHRLYLRLSKSDDRLTPIEKTLRIVRVESNTARKRGGRAAAARLEPQQTVHGANERYEEGCRCVRCVHAHRAYETALERAAHLRFRVRSVDGGYRVVDCRGRETVYRSKDQAAAEAVRDKLNRGDRFAAPSVLVDAAPVIAHLMALRDAGVTRKAIGLASGVDKGTIDSIINKPTKRTRAGNAARLLLVDGAARSENAMVDAAPVWRLLDRVNAAGFAPSWIAAALGWRAATLARRADRIKLGRAREIMTFYVGLRERLPIIGELENRETDGRAA